MKQPIDVVKLVKELPKRARGRAFIILTHDYPNQQEWTQKLAEMTGSRHVDLMETFANDKQLCEKIRGFLVSNLFEMLEMKCAEPVLVVSGMEFLKATWVGQENAIEQFANQVETWKKKPCLVFVFQYDKAIATRKFKRFPQHKFVIDQKETLAL